MTKDELMGLADGYKNSASEIFSKRIEARKTLSDAYDAALKKARSDALEEAANKVEGWEAKETIRALKEKA